MHNRHIEYTHSKVQINLIHKSNFTMPCSHFHSIYEMYYLISGSRKFFFKDRIYDIKPGHLVLVPPNVIHRTIETGEDHTRFIIEVHPDYIPFSNMEKLLKNTFQAGPVLTLPDDLRSTIEYSFDTFKEEITHNHPFREDAIKAHTLNFFILLNRYVNSTNIMPNTDAAINNKISDIIIYINNNYMNDISLASIAKEFYISRHYLSRAFKKFTGFTVGEYINNHRINEAQYLLVNTQLKIIEIASRVGFKSLSNFGKTFKHLSDNRSPKQYRNQLDES